MLTRLKVSGFKNLVDVDVRFGPFTCIAGANGVGKSNLFDAIKFLSALADKTLIDAALAVRAGEGRPADVREIFHRIGDRYTDSITLEAEMIIPATGIDDLGQEARASTTFVRYVVELGYRVDETSPSLGALELWRESLEHINIGDAPEYLFFDHRANTWRKSVVQGRRTTPFISTQEQNDQQIIKLSQDGVQGRPRSILATNLVRTVLSTVNAAESPTALLARREMQSWQLLQLEPSALREPDTFTSPSRLASNGAHLAATLYYLARSSENEAQVYAQATTRLAELLDGVRAIQVERDERRNLLTLEVTDTEGTVHPARALSDGTLRFLALAVLELDPRVNGLICLEEPENGIHPARIPAMLRLLQDIAVDVDDPVGPDNPLRQVIINTHAPAVVNQVPDDSLIVAELREAVRDQRAFKQARFSWLPDTWRARANPEMSPVAKGKLLSYLNPTAIAPRSVQPASSRRVMDRDDLQPYLPAFESQE